LEKKITFKISSVVVRNKNAEERGDTHAIKFVETWAKEASNSRLARREVAG